MDAATALGYEVVAVRSMQEALADLPGAHCNVLLTDIGLPDGTGSELMERLGSRPPYSLAMSGYGMSSDVAKSKVAGFRHHLVRPLGPEKLQGYLQEAAAEIS